MSVPPELKREHKEQTDLEVGSSHLLDQSWDSDLTRERWLGPLWNTSFIEVLQETTPEMSVELSRDPSIEIGMKVA